MTTILGLDIASTAIDGCLLVPGQAPILRRETLGHSKEPLIERLRRVPAALTGLLNEGWKTHGAMGARPDWLVIEDSYGRFRNAVRALDKVTGAIIASCPQETQIALVSTGDWRSALVAKNTKQDGHEAVIARLLAIDPHRGVITHTEHELDAIGIALGWATILEGGAER